MLFSKNVCAVAEIIDDRSNFLKLQVVIFIRSLKITTMHTDIHTYNASRLIC